jgi:hypothetical protein
MRRDGSVNYECDWLSCQQVPHGGTELRVAVSGWRAHSGAPLPIVGTGQVEWL